MNCRYKRSAEGISAKLKARCNLRADLMKPGLHYNANRRITYTADTTTQRVPIALHPAYKYHMEQFDTKSAYLHEP